MAYRKLQLRRGLYADLPTLAEGELGYCTDTKEIFVGDGSENKCVTLGPFYGLKTYFNGRSIGLNVKSDTLDIGVNQTTGQYSFDLPSAFTITLGTSWKGSAAPYTQTIASGLLSGGATPTLDLIASTTDYEAEQTEWAKVFKAVKDGTTITFYASEPTTMSLSIQVKG